MKKNIFLYLFSTMLLLGGAELIPDGSFSSAATKWQLPAPKLGGQDSQSVIDMTVSCDPNSGSLKLSRLRPNKNYWRPYAYLNIQLEPNTDYELSCYVKGQDLEAQPKYGAYIGISDRKGKSLYYGRRGLWRYDTGTFDWEKLSFKFNSKIFNLQANRVHILLGIQKGLGTVWYDRISLHKISRTAPVATKCGVEFFPVRYMKEQPWGICENLPGLLTLYGVGKLPDPRQLATLRLELPEYLFLNGVAESFPFQRQGRRALLRHNFTTCNIQRDGQNYRRYEIKFDRTFSQLFAQTWCPQNVFLSAQPGSAGRRGKIYWTLKCGNFTAPEKSFDFTILKPVKTNFKPSSKFSLAVVFPVSIYSPFPTPKKRLNQFFGQLAQTRIRMLNIDHKSDANWQNWVMTFGNCCKFPDLDAWKIIATYQKTAVKAVNFKGQKRADIACWYMLDDTDGRFDKALRANIKIWRQKHPDIKNIVWDFEPHPYGLDPAGRQRFARTQKLDHTPTLSEINSRYRQAWFKYMVNLHQQFIAKVVKILRAELPGCQVWLCSDPLHAGAETVSHWCGVDVRLADPFIDGHMPMPYYTGARYFDDLDLNLKTLKKPFVPLLDPAERNRTFFERYTPEKIRQNIMATAALGGQGFGLWPDEVLSGEYFHVLAETYKLIARYENFYAHGRRVESQFNFTPVNAIVKEIPGLNGQRQKLYFPDFRKYLRYTVHELKTSRGIDQLVTVFNYDAKSAVLLKVTGQNKSFLLEVPPQGVAVCRSSCPPNQLQLQQRAAELQKKLGSSNFQELKKDRCALEWCAGSAGEPYFKITNSQCTIWLNLLNEGEIKGLFDAHNTDLLGKGFLGKLLFYDRNQPKVTYQLQKLNVQNQIPSLTLRGQVGPYLGAIANPLQGLLIERIYQLKAQQIELKTIFTNPTARPMKLGFRLQNYPFIGQRIGAQCRRQTLINAQDILAQSHPQEEFWSQPNQLIPFPGFRKPRAWTGDAVKFQATDGVLKDQFTLQPDTAFGGIYCWYSPTFHTVEFLTPEFILPPKASKSFSLKITIP